MIAGGRAGRTGFSLIELIVVIVVVSLLAALLANRLAYYQELAEKVVMEQTVQAMRSGLQMNIATLLLNGKEGEIPQLSDQNPVRFLVEPPLGYAGELADPDAYKSLPRRSWYFDTDRREMVYLVDQDSHFRPGPDQVKWARFQVVVQYSIPTGSASERWELGAATVVSRNGFSWVMR